MEGSNLWNIGKANFFYAHIGKNFLVKKGHKIVPRRITTEYSSSSTL